MFVEKKSHTGITAMGIFLFWEFRLYSG